MGEEGKDNQKLLAFGANDPKFRWEVGGCPVWSFRLDKTGVCVHVRACAPVLLLESVGSQPGSCREPVSLTLRLGVGLRWGFQLHPGRDRA